MSSIEFIEQKEILFAGFKFVLHRRAELQDKLAVLQAAIPPEIVTGQPVLVLHYVSSEKEGTLVELGFPVSREYSDGEIRTRILEGKQHLSLLHEGPLAGLGDVYNQLFDYSSGLGIVSDEYGMEILHDISNFDLCRIETRLVVHPWEKLFHESLEEVMGIPASENIFGACSSLDAESGLDEKFERIKEALFRLEESAEDFDRYDCVSRCAHVFPKDQIQKLSDVFTCASNDGLSILEAVDRVIAFMDSDSGWSEGASRTGRTVFTAKGPRDREGYEKAQTPEEKIEAACFCPLIRKKISDGMPKSFCYCGAGWYRQQWEGATGLPVRVEILSSLLAGDPECRFAVHFPEEC